MTNGRNCFFISRRYIVVVNGYCRVIGELEAMNSSTFGCIDVGMDFIDEEVLLRPKSRRDLAAMAAGCCRQLGSGSGGRGSLRWARS